MNRISIFIITCIGCLIFSMPLNCISQKNTSASIAGESTRKYVCKVKTRNYGGGMTFSPDWQIYATTSSNNSVLLYDTSDWLVKKELKYPNLDGNYGNLREIKFSPTQKVVAVVTSEPAGGGLNNSNISFWDYDTVKILSVHKEPKIKQLITTVVFSPNGKYMAVGFGIGSVKLLDVEDPANIKILNEKLLTLDSGIGSLEFSPDSRFLAIGGGSGIKGPKNRGTFEIIDIQTGLEIYKNSDFGIIHDLAFSTNGKRLAVTVGTKDKRDIHRNLVIFNTSTWKQITELKDHPVGGGLVFTADDRFIVSASLNEIMIWDLKRKRRLKSFESESEILSLSLSPDSKSLAFLDEEGCLRIIPLAKKK